MIIKGALLMLRAIIDLIVNSVLLLSLVEYSLLLLCKVLYYCF